MEFFSKRIQQIIVVALSSFAVLPISKLRAAIVTASKNERSVAAEPPFPVGGTAARAFITQAILAPYYEHFREHAPPRRPDGAMQRREIFYRAPADPFELLTSSLGETGDDRSVEIALQQIRRAWERGDRLDSSLLASLREHAIRSSLQATRLLEAARGIQWLIGEEAADALMAAGLKKASRDEGAWPADHQKALLLMHLLDQCGCLWRREDASALVDRFTLMRRLTPALSVESRRAGYLLAESLLLDQRRGAAADLILQVLQEHDRVGDLGQLDSSDLPEMHFIAGFILFHAGRFHEAITQLGLVDGEHGKDAKLLLFESYLQVSDLETARRMVGALSRPRPQVPAPETISERLTQEVDRALWRAEVGDLPDQLKQESR